MELKVELVPALVAVLQEDPAAFEAHLEQQLVAHGLPVEFAITFSLHDAIRTALTWPNVGSWQERALHWIQERREAALVTREPFALTKIPKQQRIRHQAMRLYRKVVCRLSLQDATEQLAKPLIAQHLRVLQLDPGELDRHLGHVRQGSDGERYAISVSWYAPHGTPGQVEVLAEGEVTPEGGRVTAFAKDHSVDESHKTVG